MSRARTVTAGGLVGPGADPTPEAGGIARLLALPAAERAEIVRQLKPAERRGLAQAWPFLAHGGQLPPAGDWRVWLMRAGRGFGKTRAGAEWVSEIARTTPGARIALVAATLEEGRSVMVEGASGIVAVARKAERVEWRASRGELRFASGAVAQVYSAAAPETLRGPEHHVAWCDELAKWRHGDRAWDNLALGLRLGSHPRTLVTTTPRPVTLLKRIMAQPGTVETLGGTRDNPHLLAVFLKQMETLYGGTRLGRQELEGALVEDREGALWTRGAIEAARGKPPALLARVVVGVDPPAGAAQGGGDACGIVAVGRDREGVAHVLEDASVRGLAPEGWAAAVAGCAARHGADRVVAEANQGGAMVDSVLRTADAGLPIQLVHASRGKVARAEPVSLLTARGRLRFAGRFPALEDELCGLLTGGDYAGPGRSPDRADAMVWAVSALMFGPRGVAGVRVLG